MTTSPLHKAANAGKSAAWYVMVLFVSVLTVVPFLWTLTTSFKSPGEILQDPLHVLPLHFTWSNYSDVFSTVPFGRDILNSLIIAVVGVLTNCLFGALAGYAFARLKFFLKGPIFAVFLATMMIPNIVTMVPTFIILHAFPLAGGNNIFGHGGRGFIDSLWGVVLPGAVGAFAIFMMRQFFGMLPSVLADAARVDGASEFRIFRSVYLPLVWPALAVLAIITFQAYWNSFLWPLIVLNSPNKQTVQLGLATFKYTYSTNYGPLMAGTIMATIPVILIFILAQKRIIEGVAFTGITS